MGEPANMLAAQGFAVFVLHYLIAPEPRKSPTSRPSSATSGLGKDCVGRDQSHRATSAGRCKAHWILGFSLGAYLALSVASVDPRVKAVVEFFGGCR